MTRRAPLGTPDPALVVAASRARTQEILVAGLLHEIGSRIAAADKTLDDTYEADTEPR